MQITKTMVTRRNGQVVVFVTECFIWEPPTLSTPRFVRRLVDERRIPFHKIGKYVRFDPADIDRFVMDGRIEI